MAASTNQQLITDPLSVASRNDNNTQVSATKEKISDEDIISASPMMKVDLYLTNRWGRLDQRHCSHCQTSVVETKLGATRYKCLQCASFWLCDVCFTSAEFIHQGHKFQTINLHTRFPSLFTTPESAIDGYGSKLDQGRRQYIMVPRNCCPTCLDHRPGEIGHRYAASKSLQYSSRHYPSPTEWKSDHELHPSDLKRSEENGCSLCSIALRGLMKVAPRMVADDRQLGFRVTADDIRIGDFGFVHNEYESKSGHYSICGRQGHRPYWPALRQATSISQSLASEACFAKMRAWVDSCQQKHSHPDCSRSAKCKLPDRVIAINSIQGNTSLKLLITKGEHERYIALSHRWGSSTGLITTSENIANMCKSIYHQNLPQTFSDAVICAQNLGIKYLWIDSLCIIQDDLQDWQRQSAKMESYYSDAFLVIAAASADGHSAGFLKDRPPIYTGIPFESKPGSGIDDMVVQRIMPHCTDSNLTSQAAMEHDYIESRAWCMQETILARRTLYFHHSEMVWQCQSLIDCECGRSFNRYDSDTTSSTVPQSYEADTDILEFLEVCSGLLRYSGKPLSLVSSVESAFVEWRHGIVPLYTTKKLTRQSDKLPALSGLASKISEYLKSQGHDNQYLAGIWRGDPLGLLWSVSEIDHGYLFDGDESRAPSFSWVSVSTEIHYKIPPATQSPQFPDVYGAMKCTILDASVGVDGENPFGAVSDGFIKVSGLALDLTIRLGTSAEEMYWLECGPGVFSIQFQADTNLAPIKIRKKKGHTFTLNRFGSSVFDERHKDGTPEIRVDGLVVANLPSANAYAMLVLGKSITRPGAFQRLGIASVTLKEAYNQRWVDKLAVREFTII